MSMSLYITCKDVVACSFQRGLDHSMALSYPDSLFVFYVMACSHSESHSEGCSSFGITEFESYCNRFPLVQFY